MAEKPIFERVLVKLSGEVLMGSQSFGIDPDVAQSMAREIQGVHSLGVQTAAVIGGGNIFRGIAPSARGMDRVSADHMGMLATVINAVALQDALDKERDILRSQAEGTGKPPNVIEKIVEGKLSKFYSENVLLEQPYIKDPDQTVEEYMKSKIAVLKENIQVRRFVRFERGESIA